jgi:DNA-binding CsgD family transcriptional regulator
MARLTRRQAEVARLIATGETTKGVARKLGISVSTAKIHVRDGAARLPGPGRPTYRLLKWALEQDGESG